MDLLQSKKVRFYCIQCDNHWNATDDDAKKIAQLLVS